MQSFNTPIGPNRSTGFQGYTDFLTAGSPAKPSAADSAAVEPTDSFLCEGTYVTPTSRRIACPVTLSKLEKELDDLDRTKKGSAQSPVAIDTATGKVELAAEVRARPLPANHEVLPLRLGALRKSLNRISEGDPFLLSNNPIFYIDGKGQAHIDFVNLAGFVVDPFGALMNRAVNPW